MAYNEHYPHRSITLRAAALSRATLPIYRASLPPAEKLVSYLVRIDANRWYTNRGELAATLEARLGALLCAKGAQVITAASGTAAIEAAILATAGRATPDRPLALIPAYTFIATAAAAERCGYTPYVLDVDPVTWALSASGLIDHQALTQAGVVVPVAPYGRRIPQADWLDFQTRTNVRVVIDAAAGFEAIAADPEHLTGHIPVALSFQATKAFSSGEGGAVVWSDADGLLRVIRSLNFGIYQKRESTSSGLNGKMSEYHAAVGLASLDAWTQTCRANRAVTDAYLATARSHEIAGRLVIAPDLASNYALLDTGSSEAANDVIDALHAENIESRRWYGNGLHREPYLRDVQRDELPTTDRIAPSVLGLPISGDITLADIERTILTASIALGRYQNALV